MTMPLQQPGKSRQDYQTPPAFLDAVRKRLGIVGFHIDLAATKDNTIAPQFYDEAKDALTQPWYFGPGAWGWCNPPYADIEPWVAKAYDELNSHGTQTAMLLPASVDTNWWIDYVHDTAHVLFLTGRLTFVGMTTPYPKGSALLLYQPCAWGGYEVWPWKTGITKW